MLLKGKGQGEGPFDGLQGGPCIMLSRIECDFRLVAFLPSYFFYRLDACCRVCCVAARHTAFDNDNYKGVCSCGPIGPEEKSSHHRIPLGRKIVVSFILLRPITVLTLVKTLPHCFIFNSHQHHHHHVKSKSTSARGDTITHSATTSSIQVGCKTGTFSMDRL